MFSIPTFNKLIVLAIIVIAVYLWSKGRAVQARGGQGNGQTNARNAASRGNAANRAPVNAQQKQIQDLVKCPSCGTYMASGSNCSCGQAGR